MPRPIIRVDITSDILCPFCWIGKRALEAAMAERKGQVDFEVAWHPFFLRRGVPAEGIDKVEAYAQKFGRANAERMLYDPNSQLKVHGRQYGLEFRYTKGCVVGDSSLGHRLLWYTLDKYGCEKQNELMEVIFRRYFQDNENIGQMSCMVGAGAEVGLSEQEVTSMLQSSQYRKELDKQDNENHMRGISGVPHFDISLKGHSKTYTTSGAQHPSHFVSIVDKLSKLSA